MLLALTISGYLISGNLEEYMLWKVKNEWYNDTKWSGSQL